MPRKPIGANGSPPPDEVANDSPVLFAEAGSSDRKSVGKKPSILTMTTSPAFDTWLDRQMKSLLAACSEAPNQALIDLVRTEMGKRENKVTE